MSQFVYIHLYITIKVNDEFIEKYRFFLPSVFSVSDNLSEIELAAKDFVNVSVSGKIRLDDIVFPSRFGVGGKALRTELFLICGQNENVQVSYCQIKMQQIYYYV